MENAKQWITSRQWFDDTTVKDMSQDDVAALHEAATSYNLYVSDRAQDRVIGQRQRQHELQTVDLRLDHRISVSATATTIPTNNSRSVSVPRYQPVVSPIGGGLLFENDDR